MNDQEKKQAAMNLMMLRRSWKAAPVPNWPDEVNESHQRYFETLRGAMAEVYSECFTDEQLQALLDFYGSEMGRSIVDAESKLAPRFQERLHDVSQKLNEQGSSLAAARRQGSNPLVGSVSSDNPAIAIVASEGRSSSPWKVPARWRLEIRGGDGSNPRFKAAIALDGHLDLLDEVAPYDREFSASRLIVLFESVGEANLSVVVFSDASGAYMRQFSGSGGRSGRIIFDSSIPAYQAGSL